MGGLDLRFLGDFRVIRDGHTVPLPPSRKTRALLAWLCLQDRPFRREQLCDLLWEIPDDPRGSLRWSLSKLRRLLDTPDRQRVLADRSSVRFDASDIAIDVRELHALAQDGLKDATADALEAAAARFRGTFLEDLEFSNFHTFHAWCIAEREQAARSQAKVLHELVKRLEHLPERALPHARALVIIAPYDEPSRAMLIRLLHASRHVDEANQQFQLGMRLLKEAGITSTGALQRALRGGVAAPPVPELPVSTVPVAVPPTAGGAALAGGGATACAAPELVGRDCEQQQLADTFARVARQHAAEALLLLGEPGIGKTRLLGCARRLALEHGVRTLEASAFEAEAIRPFALWMDALRVADPAAAARLFGGREIENRDRLFSGLSEWIAGQAEAAPVVLMFDDLQWCDESSAAALHYVARTNRSRPLLAVLAARAGDFQDNVPLQQALRGLRHAGLLREVNLSALPCEAAARLIAQHSPGADCARLGRECGGNPLLAIELARAEQDGAGSGSLDQLVRERVARLGVNGADILRWAAVLNPRIDVPTLAHLTGLGSAEIAAALEQAARQAIVCTDASGIRFSHDLVARAVYTGISPVRRQVMHRLVAEMLEAEATPELTRAADLAHHAAHSGDPGLAAKAMVSAGQLCLRFFANDEAMSLARKGLQLADRLPAAERTCLQIDLHGILVSAAPVDDWEEAAAHYAALAEEALEHGALAHARRGYTMAAWLRWQHGHWNAAREQSLQSERAARGASDEDQIIGMAETARCLVLLERDVAQADAMLMEAQARARRAGFRYHAIPGALGMLRFYENRLDEAEELLKDARTLCKSAGDRFSEYQANEYLVMIAIQRGQFAEAKHRCRDLLDIGRRLREGSEAPFAAAVHALCVYALEDADADFDAALQDLRIADAKHRLAYVLTRAALLDYERGRTAKAVARASEALEHARALQRGSEMLLAHVVLGLGCEASGRAAEARQHLSRIAALESAGVAVWASGMAAILARGGRKAS